MHVASSPDSPIFICMINLLHIARCMNHGTQNKISLGSFLYSYRARPVARVMAAIAAAPQIVDVMDRSRGECMLNSGPHAW